MKVTLIFPPRTSPTYLPLGLASIIGYLRNKVPLCSISCLDLNVETWIWLAEREPGGSGFLNFLRGKEGGFFDEKFYLPHRRTWDLIRTKFERLASRARQYLIKGTSDSDFVSLLDLHAEMVLFSDPEAIGFSIFSLEQVPFALSLAKRIKEVSFTKREMYDSSKRFIYPRIYLGGAAMSALYSHELVEACPFIDGVVMGEGETAIAALCSGQPHERVPGLVFRSACGIKQNPKSSTMSLKDFPIPDFSDFKIEQYPSPAPVLPVLFSRGCMWRKCRFCFHNRSFSGYRRKTIESFVSELEGYHKRYGASHFYLADQYVGARDLEAVAEAMIDRDSMFFFHVMGRPLEEYSSGRLEKVFRAGCRWISWGVESGSQRLLDLIHKGTNVQVMERVLRDAKNSGISNLIMMIFGLPTSSQQDLWQTFRFIENVYDYVDAASMSAFVLWAKTEFARNARQYGMHILGRQEFIRVGDKPVHSLRLKYLAMDSANKEHLLQGPLELEAWENHKKWLGDFSFLELLPCEHYLLYVTHRAESQSKPLSPTRRAA